MASSCILNANETFVCSYASRAPEPGVQSLIHVSTTPLWMYYSQEAINNFAEGYADEYIYGVIRYILAPMFFAYLWSPNQPQINVFVPESGPVVIREGEPEPEDDLDETSKQILTQLRGQPSGLTAKRLFKVLQVYDPDVEEFDVNGRLYALSEANLVWRARGTHTAVRWMA